MRALNTVCLDSCYPECNLRLVTALTSGYPPVSILRTAHDSVELFISLEFLSKKNSDPTTERTLS